MKKVILNESTFNRLFEANTNKALNKTRHSNNDEIYTHIDEVTNELSHYKNEFRNKVIYCNCDDSNSAFYQYFISNFNSLGLKYLYCTTMNNGGIMIIYDGDNISKTKLNGNGDMFSNECVNILDKSDIVVTNPPFSQIHKIIDLITSHGKKYLMIGPVTAMQKRHIDKINNGDFGFGYTDGRMRYSNTNKTYGNHRWLTNLIGDDDKPQKTINNVYDSTKYAMDDSGKYLIVARGNELPYDYDGLIAISKSYTASIFNPKDKLLHVKTPNGDTTYRIVGIGENLKVNGKRIFDRVIIQKR